MDHELSCGLLGHPSGEAGVVGLIPNSEVRWRAPIRRPRPSELSFQIRRRKQAIPAVY